MRLLQAKVDETIKNHSTKLMNGRRLIVTTKVTQHFAVLNEGSYKGFVGMIRQVELLGCLLYNFGKLWVMHVTDVGE